MDGPDQNYHLDKIEQEFAWVTNGAVRGCVGAIDGVAIRIRRPLSSDSGLFGRVDNPALYFNRKGFYSVNMQAVVDRRGRFLNVSIVTPGSTCDSVAHLASPLGQYLEPEKAKLPLGYFLVGDAAYASSNQTITPYPGRGLAVSKDSFNFHQSSMRLHVVFIVFINIA